MAMFRPLLRGIVGASNMPRTMAAPSIFAKSHSSQAAVVGRFFSTAPDPADGGAITTTTTNQSLSSSRLYEDFSKMSNEELAEASTIPGWDLIHSPPRNFPRGALVGTVVSTRMQKTVNVAVDRYRIVPKIRKRQRYTRKFFAHDENEVANMGDLVMITPCHRISKFKHFMLREIIRPKGQLS
uniref:30S ribosomal protein S17, chloroplastic n=1 Tax=Amphora coffeiformis TaxID=265554 RepID=A0A7S3P821_9STRA|mmetsp:Transcript_4664/g.8885  ORF Transcript_4664/g.8885 Transcript_4664/m.8885 type:complete len:183 (-) Transcript_4664:36-584(-)|eukprot:scaffold3586_cov164-Amphora_coffeaeformis.AAC.6